MKQNLLCSLFLLLTTPLCSQIIFNKTTEYLGEIENFNGKLVEFQCLNKYDHAVEVLIESISQNIEVKLSADTIPAMGICTASVSIYPLRKGSLREYCVFKFSDGSTKRIDINGYISSFDRFYDNNLQDDKLSSEKDIIFMLVDGTTQKPVPNAKIYISNIHYDKNYIGYADAHGILKNRIPEGKYLIQCLTEGYKREILGRKIDPELNIAMILMDKAVTEPVAAKVDTVQPDSSTAQTTEPSTAEAEKPKRRSLNIIMLIDNSISMGEEKRMEQVKTSITHLIRNYNREDRIAILTFNEQVHTILSPSTIENPSEIYKKIDEIQVSGKTNGEVGINQAFELMEDIAGDSSLNMIVVATDGRLANSTYVENKLMKKIEQMNMRGYLLSVMGFTNSSYHSKKMQQMADTGGGIYLDMNNHKEDYNSILLDEIYKTLLKIEQ